MAFHEPTDRARANWDALDLQQQFAAVMWAARHLHRTGRMKEISPDVTRLGAGRRECGTGTHVCVHDDEACLVVYVARKWKERADRPRKARKGRIPERLQISVPTDDGRRALALPTDVCAEPRPPKPHARSNGARIRSVDFPQVPAINGSVCALVRNVGQNDGPRYLLGCHHVIFRSLVTPGATPDRSAYAMTIATPEESLGLSTRPAPFGPDVPASVDAALVRLIDDGLDIATSRAFWKVVPVDWIRTADELPFFVSDPWHLISQFRRVGLSYLRHAFDQPVVYESGVTVVISEVIISRSKSSTRPQAGDSGGAVVDDDILIGMHIAGDGRLSYAIPAYVLLGGPAFRPRLTLASDEIG